MPDAYREEAEAWLTGGALRDEAAASSDESVAAAAQNSHRDGAGIGVAP